MKRISMDEAIKIIEDDTLGGCDYTFRGDNFVPVRKFRPSRYHGDDGRANVSVGGVSAIYIPAAEPEYIIKAAQMARAYGANLFLLKGESENTDGDYHEVVMTSHRIVAIVE